MRGSDQRSEKLFSLLTASSLRDAGDLPALSTGSRLATDAPSNAA
jgi:hypothetical protein